MIDRVCAPDLGLSGYITESLTMDHSHCIWRIPSSLYIKALKTPLSDFEKENFFIYILKLVLVLIMLEIIVVGHEATNNQSIKIMLITEPV